MATSTTITVTTTHCHPTNHRRRPRRENQTHSTRVRRRLSNGYSPPSGTSSPRYASAAASSTPTCWHCAKYCSSIAMPPYSLLRISARRTKDGTLPQQQIRFPISQRLRLIASVGRISIRARGASDKQQDWTVRCVVAFWGLGEEESIRETLRMEGCRIRERGALLFSRHVFSEDSTALKEWWICQIIALGSVWRLNGGWRPGCCHCLRRNMRWCSRGRMVLRSTATADTVTTQIPPDWQSISMPTWYYKR